MKIKLLKIMAGPKGSFQPGVILEMSDEEGKYMIESLQGEAYIEPEKVETEAKLADVPPVASTAELDPLKNAEVLRSHPSESIATAGLITDK